jgi:phage baseplate assembly protein W
MMMSEEEAPLPQCIVELKECNFGRSEYGDVTEVSVDRNTEEALEGQIVAIEEVMFCQFENRIRLEDQFWAQIKQRDGVDVVVAKHIAENASIQKKIADKLQERIRLRDVLRWQQSKYWEPKGDQTRPYAEAFSMMAVKSLQRRIKGERNQLHHLRGPWSRKLSVQTAAASKLATATVVHAKVSTNV